MEDIRILYIGCMQAPDALSYIKAFPAAGYETTAVNYALEYFPQEIDGIKITNLNQREVPISINRYKLHEVSMMLLGRYSRDSRMAVLRELIIKNRINVIFCNWGVTVLPIILMIKNEFPRIPVIHELNTYPSFVNPAGVAIQNFFYGKAVGRIEGRIHGSRQMYDYLNSRFGIEHKGRDLINPLYFTERFFFKKRHPLLSETGREPHLIFLGRADFSSKRPRDDIRLQIQEITSKRIHVWVSSRNSNIEEGEYVHFYPWFSEAEVMNGTMASYMTQFDGCIYLHNLKNPHSMYANSLQTRFRFALTAAIPIIMPSGIYDAAQELVEENAIGFTYSGYDELAAKLSDGSAMNRYRKQMTDSARKFTFEYNFDKIDSFIRKITENQEDK